MLINKGTPSNLRPEACEANGGLTHRNCLDMFIILALPTLESLNMLKLARHFNSRENSMVQCFLFVSWGAK